MIFKVLLIKKMRNSNLLKIQWKELIVPALLGASLPLALISFMILTREPRFESWMYSPLLIIPSGGAVGGISIYLLGCYWFSSGIKKLLAILLGLVLYFVGVWMASVIAFALTGHWN